MKTFKQQLRDYNLIHYKGKQPSRELVKSILEKSGLSYTSFYKIYGLADKTIERYLNGLREMPVKYWHIFYEFDHLEVFYSKFNLRHKRELRLKKTKEEPKEESEPEINISSQNKSIINAYRERLNQR